MSQLIAPSTSTARHQRGATLIVAMVMMIIFALVGLTALKTSDLQIQMSTNSQLDKLAFQGAESATEGVLRTVRIESAAGIGVRSPQSIMARALSGVDQLVCLDAASADGVNQAVFSSTTHTALCPNGLNEFAQTRAWAVVREPEAGETNITPPQGYDVERGLGFVGVVAEATGEIGGVSATHIQVWGVLGPQL